MWVGKIRIGNLITKNEALVKFPELNVPIVGPDDARSLILVFIDEQEHLKWVNVSRFLDLITEDHMHNESNQNLMLYLLEYHSYLLV